MPRGEITIACWAPPMEPDRHALELTGDTRYEHDGCQPINEGHVLWVRGDLAEQARPSWRAFRPSLLGKEQWESDTCVHLKTVTFWRIWGLFEAVNAEIESD